MRIFIDFKLFHPSEQLMQLSSQSGLLSKYLKRKWYMEGHWDVKIASIQSWQKGLQWISWLNKWVVIHWVLPRITSRIKGAHSNMFFYSIVQLKFTCLVEDNTGTLRLLIEHIGLVRYRYNNCSEVSTLLLCWTTTTQDSSLKIGGVCLQIDCALSILVSSHKLFSDAFFLLTEFWVCKWTLHLFSKWFHHPCFQPFS